MGVVDVDDEELQKSSQPGLLLSLSLFKLYEDNQELLHVTHNSHHNYNTIGLTDLQL